MVQSLFLLLLIMVLAFFIFKISFKTTKEVTDSAKLSDKNIELLNILRTEYNGKELSDVLVESYMKNDYKNFENGLKPALDRMYGNAAIPGFIVVKAMPADKKVFESSSFLQVYELDKRVPSAYLPVNKDVYLEVKLYE